MSESIEVVVLRMQANIEEIQSALQKAEDLLPNLIHKKANGHREKHVKENTQTNFVKEIPTNTTVSNEKCILLENLMKAEGKLLGEGCFTSSKTESNPASTLDANHTIPLPLNTDFALQAIGATSKAASLLVPATGADHAPRPASVATHASLPNTSKHNVSWGKNFIIPPTAQSLPVSDPAAVSDPTPLLPRAETTNNNSSPGSSCTNILQPTQDPESVTLYTELAPACILPAPSLSTITTARASASEPITPLPSPTPNPKQPTASAVSGWSLPHTTSTRTSGHKKPPTHALLTHHNNAVAALSAPVSLPATTSAGAKRSREVIDLVDSDSD